MMIILMIIIMMMIAGPGRGRVQPAEAPGVRAAGPKRPAPKTAPSRGYIIIPIMRIMRIMRILIIISIIINANDNVQ